MKYDYLCTSCDMIREIDKKISESSRVECCPECKAKMTKLPPRKTSFILKGDGWYNKGGY